MGNTDLAIVYYELACAGQWNARFGDVHNIAHELAKVQVPAR